MIKVCLITTSFPRHENSYQGIFIQKFIENMLCKVEFIVLAPSDKNECTTNYKKYKVVWVRYSVKKWEKIFNSLGGLPQRFRGSLFSYWNLPFFLVSMIFAALKHTRKNDIIHVQWLQNGLFAILPKLIWKKPVIITVHGSDLKLFLNHRIHNLIGRIIIYFADAIITVNEDYEKILKEKYKSKLIKYIPNAYKINPEFNMNKFVNQETKTILFVGSLIKEKGIFDLMFIYEKLINNGIIANLKIIGDGNLMDELLNWSKSFSVDLVKIMGAIPNEEVINEMRISDILVLPSYSEGRPTVILEAMANALPVVATNLKGIQEIITDNYNGKLFNPGDQTIFYNIMKEAVSGKLPLQKYVENSFEVLNLKKITIENNVENHMVMYNTVLKNSI